jgi:recombinational DNA repair protein (RecF pathway)
LALEYDRQMDKKERKEARALMRKVLAHYLGNKPIKSRELFQAL